MFCTATTVQSEELMAAGGGGVRRGREGEAVKNIIDALWQVNCIIRAAWHVAITMRN